MQTAAIKEWYHGQPKPYRKKAEAEVIQASGEHKAGPQELGNHLANIEILLILLVAMAHYILFLTLKI